MGRESRVPLERFPGAGQGRATFPGTQRTVRLTGGLRDGEERFEEVLAGLKSRYSGSSDYES